MLRSSRKLQVESLEKRELMAGNVNIAIQGSDLVITGDNSANQVFVSRNGANLNISGGAYGGDFTRINGRVNGTYSVTGTARNIIVNLNGGNDDLQFGSGNQQVISMNDSLKINMGAGNDSCNVRDVKTNGSLWVTTSTGQDRTSVSNAKVAVDLLIGDGGGAYNGDFDQATVNNSTARQIGFGFNQGNDSVNIVASTADNVFANLGAGNDSFSMTFTKTPRGFSVDGGSGYDTFFVPDYAGTRYNGKNFEVVRRG